MLRGGGRGPRFAETPWGDGKGSPYGVAVTIHGSRAAVWRAITDVERAAEFITGVEKVEVLERPGASRDPMAP